MTKYKTPAHEILIRAHDILKRAHDILKRALKILIRAHVLAKACARDTNSCARDTKTCARNKVIHQVLTFPRSCPLWLPVGTPDVYKHTQFGHNGEKK